MLQQATQSLLVNANISVKMYQKEERMNEHFPTYGGDWQPLEKVRQLLTKVNFQSQCGKQSEFSVVSM